MLKMLGLTLIPPHPQHETKREKKKRHNYCNYIQIYSTENVTITIKVWLKKKQKTLSLNLKVRNLNDRWERKERILQAAGNDIQAT